MQEKERTKKKRTIHVSELKRQQTQNTSEQLQHADTTDATQHWNSKDPPKILQGHSKDTKR